MEGRERRTGSSRCSRVVVDSGRAARGAGRSFRITIAKWVQPRLWETRDAVVSPAPWSGRFRPSSPHFDHRGAPTRECALSLTRPCSFDVCVTVTASPHTRRCPNYVPLRDSHFLSEVLHGHPFTQITFHARFLTEIQSAECPHCPSTTLGYSQITPECY
jgi:hypothetical protein